VPKIGKLFMVRVIGSHSAFRRNALGRLLYLYRANMISPGTGASNAKGATGGEVWWLGAATCLALV